MNPERWRQIEELFHAALERAPENRQQFLEDACRDDADLRLEVESLLAHREQAGSFLETPAMPNPDTFSASGALVGRQLGPYRILSPLGAGGMGEVYRAHDSKLGRDVAIKTLPLEFAGDTERLARFRREARTLATLNHPNIAAIYGLEESDNVDYLVLELVEGETLSEPIKRIGPLPVEKALDCARQVAEALEAAHSKGIVHRDLKPANVKVTPEGRVKVLDFGLAKAVRGVEEDQDLSQLVTVTQLETIVGHIVGTPPYMSPEQARGKDVDSRTDIWAFGCLLYELLTGKRAFQGDTFSDTIAAVLEREPDWSALPAKTPAKIRELLRRCLERDPGRRLSNTEDARRTIEQTQRGSKRWPLAAAAAVAILASAAAVWMRNPARQSDPSQWVQVTRLPDSVMQPALSPDGRMLAFLRGSNTFIGEAELYVKLVPDGEPVQLTHDKTRKMSPAFSPDSSRIAYTALGQNNTWDTWTVPLPGGTPELWLPNAAALTWVDSQRILFSEIKAGMHMALLTARVSRTESRDVYVPAHQLGMAHRSHLSPDGKWVLIVEMDEQSNWMPCRLVPVDGSSPGHQIGPPMAACTFASWSPDGKWMYLSVSASGGQYHLWRQRFPDGKPEQITSGPTQEEGIAVSPDGHSLITAVSLRQRPVWFHDGSGDHQISLEGYGWAPRLDIAGRKLYYRVTRAAAATRQGGELWVSDLDSRRNEPVLAGFNVVGFDISDDGRLLVSAKDSDGKPRLWLAPLDRRSPPRQIAGIESGYARFGPSGDVLFLAKEGDNQFLFRIHEDGSGLQKVTPGTIQEIYSVARRGEWVSGLGTITGKDAGSFEFAYSTVGRSPVPICSPPCMVQFAPDGKFIYLSLPEGWMNFYASGRTYVLATQPGSVFPKLPPGGFKSEAEIAAVPGVRVIDAADVGAGPSPDVYAFSREVVQRNLYRIPLP